MRNSLLIIAAAVAAAGAHAEPTKPEAADKSAEISKEQAEKILAQCGERRFETTAAFEVDGTTRRTGIRMCAQPGDSDADWIGRLEKAAAAVEAQPSLPDSAKSKLLSDLRGEIARLKLLQASPPTTSFSLRPPAPATAPPLGASDALVATVPPMPAPPPPQKSYPIGTVPAAMLVPPPPLSIRCLDSGERKGGTPCFEFDSHTVLAVEADADFASRATLRFMRKDRPRGEIAVGPLRRGQVVQIRIPREVCTGVVRSELAIEVVPGAPGTNARPTSTKGPYTLRC